MVASPKGLSYMHSPLRPASVLALEEFAANVDNWTPAYGRYSPAAKRVRKIYGFEAKKGERDSLIKKHATEEEGDMYINDYSEKNSTKHG